MFDFERRVVPTFGLSELVLDTPTLERVKRLVEAGKAHKFISAQWGFSQGSGCNVAHPGGIVCVVCGGVGTGKTTLAHALAFELGQPVKVRTSYNVYAY